MLAAGADPVFYIQTSDMHLPDAWKKLSELIGKDEPVVIESGGLAEMLDPGLSILVTSPYEKDKKIHSGFNRAKIETRFEKFDLLLNNICFRKGSWQWNK
jgi:hypothetical protein